MDFNLTQTFALPKFGFVTGGFRVELKHFAFAVHFNRHSWTLAGHDTPGDAVAHAAKFAHPLGIDFEDAIAGSQSHFIRRPILLHITYGSGRFGFTNRSPHYHDDDSESQGQQETE